MEDEPEAILIGLADVVPTTVPTSATTAAKTAAAVTISAEASSDVGTAILEGEEAVTGEVTTEARET